VPSKRVLTKTVIIRIVSVKLQRYIRLKHNSSEEHTEVIQILLLINIYILKCYYFLYIFCKNCYFSITYAFFNLKSTNNIMNYNKSIQCKLNSYNYTYRCINYHRYSTELILIISAIIFCLLLVVIWNVYRRAKYYSCIQS